MIVAHLIAIVLALMIDRLIGDPRWLPHPVVGMGNLISILDKRLNNGKKKRQKGLWMLMIVLVTVLIISMIITIAAYALNSYVGIVVEGILISTTLAAKGLKDAAEEVRKPLAAGDLEDARLKLSYIVGRDTEELTEEEITRAAVETVAENTTDGVTASLFFAFIGGAPLALLYRAINTCDSMVGYKNEKYEEFGWASAKCDDIVNYIPSRITAIIMILSSKPKCGQTRWQCWTVVTRDAVKHLSPNSGWGEAPVAALLGIRLGGTNTYKGIVSERATMGNELIQITPLHIKETNSIMIRTVIGFTLFLIVIGGVLIVFT